MLLLGLLIMGATAGIGTLLVWENRDVVVHVHIAKWVWTGHLYGVLALGALLTCWFLLGASFIRCRIAELRRSHPRRRKERAETMGLPAAR